ncbi:13566_t:CDS:2, partial [Racocetra fulgida]
LATKFDDEIVRHSATAALSHIDNLNRTRNRFQPNIGESDDTSIGSPNRRRRNARQVENVKLKMGIQIDDVHFRNMLLDTQESERYVQLGCTLITTLLANFDGVKYLESNKFLRQISDNLNQLVPP